jgi:hypothetical protein
MLGFHDYITDIHKQVMRYDLEILHKIFLD